MTKPSVETNSTLIETKGKRGLKNRTPFSNAIRTDLLLEFKALSAKTQINQSRLLDQAIELLLDAYR